MQIPSFFKMNYPCKESFRHEKFPYEIETNKRKRKRERMKKRKKYQEDNNNTRRYNERACIAGSLAERSYLEIDSKSLT